MRHAKTPTDEGARFALLKHCRASNDHDACWTWAAAKKESGYGRIRYRGVEYIASRLSYAVHYGDPGALDVCHRCDNPECCNPRHLFLTDHAGNISDAVEKGRWRRKGTGVSRNKGQQNPQFRFSEDERARMREMYQGGMKQSEIARAFGCSRPYVSTVCADLRLRRPIVGRESEVEAMIEAGLGNREIANQFGVHHSRISQIRRSIQFREPRSTLQNG